MINIDQLLKKPVETLLVVFFNTVQNNEGNFEIQSNYRQTKFLKITNSSYRQTATQLSKKYGLDFKYNNSAAIAAIIENNRKLNLEEFFSVIYEAILPKLNKLSSNLSLDVEFALALFILRGSADFNHGFYSVDLKNLTYSYFDNFFKLLLSTDDLLSRLNLNFRELQPQFVTGKNLRNTQVRINLKWFYDNVVRQFSHINQYKTKVLEKNIKILGEIRKYRSFEDRLIFYRQSVLGRKLKQQEINSLRRELEFSQKIEPTKDNKFLIRNQKIVSYAREIFDDVCVGCGDHYNIADRSFKMPKDDRYYFEINHIIAYSNDSSTVDVLDNLVKLCPTCHRALTPGRAYESLQKSIIKKMINSRIEVKRFIKSMMAGRSLSLVDYVYSKLK